MLARGSPGIVVENGDEHLQAFLLKLACAQMNRSGFRPFPRTNGSFGNPRALRFIYRRRARAEKVEIDHIPWLDPDGKFRRIELIIGTKHIILYKYEVVALGGILDREIGNIWIDIKIKDKSEPLKKFKINYL